MLRQRQRLTKCSFHTYLTCVEKSPPTMAQKFCFTVFQHSQLHIRTGKLNIGGRCLYLQLLRLRDLVIVACNGSSVFRCWNKGERA